MTVHILVYILSFQHLRKPHSLCFEIDVFGKKVTKMPTIKPSLNGDQGDGLVVGL
jgi:hypothetical protein